MPLYMENLLDAIFILCAFETSVKSLGRDRSLRIWLYMAADRGVRMVVVSGTDRSELIASLTKILMGHNAEIIDIDHCQYRAAEGLIIAIWGLESGFKTPSNISCFL